MVDREARDKAAQLLEAFKDGLITNDDFEDGWPLKSQDQVFEAIRWTVWGFYSDLHQQPLGERNWVRGKGSDELDLDGKALFERCILFLKSDLLYDPLAPCPGPPQPGRGQLRALASLILIGGVVVAFVLWGFSSRTAGLLMLWGLLWTLLYHLAEHAVCRAPEGWSIGTVSWPFASQNDYERAKSQTPNPK